MNEILKLSEYCKSISCKHSLDEPMKNHTTFKIGGNAEIFIEPNDIEQISNVLKQAKILNVNTTFMGNGSNVLVRDEGIKGAVVCLSNEFSKVEMIADKVLYCTAGANLTQLCHYAYNNGLSGLEFAWGIPANVGGAVYMNAGAYGGEIKDVLKSAKYLDENFEIVERSVDELEMAYRHSFFTNKHYLILSAIFQLEHKPKEEIKAKMDELMTARKTKQPLEYPSAGSTFKRPVGAYAAALIDECNLKGARAGGAMVSEKHAGFVINYDNASCKDVLDLVELVKEKVKTKTGHILECEVKII